MHARDSARYSLVNYQFDEINDGKHVSIYVHMVMKEALNLKGPS